MVTYVTETSKWEKWQRDYKLGLILIMPPGEVSQQIDALRAKHDPCAFAICPTHISLSDPLRRELTPELEEEIRGILSLRIPRRAAHSCVTDWSSLSPIRTSIFREWARSSLGLPTRTCPTNRLQARRTSRAPDPGRWTPGD